MQNLTYKSFSKFLKALALYLNLLFIFSACSLFEKNKIERPYNFQYDEAVLLMQVRDYKKAEPYLLSSLSREDDKYAETLLMLAKVYDQTQSPEKCILNSQDYLSRQLQPAFQVKALALLMKCRAKVNRSIAQASEKAKLNEIVALKSANNKEFIESLHWAMEFTCEENCLAEVAFFKEIQPYFFLVLEKNPATAQRVTDILWSRYDFFASFLEDKKPSQEFKIKLASELYSSLQKLKTYHLDQTTQSSVLTASVLLKLDPVLKKVEMWMYDRQSSSR